MPRTATAVTDSLKKVPPFPPVAVKLLSLLANPAVDTNEVADLISSDATFTARLLQRVNSAEFGFVSDIRSVRRSVELLGLDTTRQVTVATAMGAYAQGGLKTETMRRCWQHTVATAVLAQEIALACDAFSAIAFTAGIMHDIGRLGLLSEMALIAGRHHDPCEGVELDLLRIVHVACRLADVLGYDVVRPLVPSSVGDVIAQLPARARTLLVQDPEQLCERVEQRIREFGSESADAPPEETLALLASAS